MGHDATEFVPLAPRAGETETARWVRRAQEGDHQAFDLLVQRFQGMAVGYGAALLGDFHLGEDAAQEAFVETFRVLPALHVPEAFPAYLRLSVRKHCDRMTRRKRVPVVPLEAARHVEAAQDVVRAVENRERSAVLREVVQSLPESERIATLLFYVGSRSLKEVAAFLDVPVSTVKNRLHSARRKLRERMTPMEEPLETTGKLSYPDDGFRGRVIARLYNEYREQFRADTQTADRTLIERARAELRLAVAEGVPDARTAHAGIRVLLWSNDFAAFPALMGRYLEQPLPPSEEFWARWTRIRGLAAARQAEAVVHRQRELMAWQERHDGAAEVRLSVREPFAPPDDEDEETLPSDALGVFALGIAEVGMCYAQAGLLDEWLTIVRETLSAAPRTAANRLWRFYQLRHAVHLLGTQGQRDAAMAFVDEIRALADEGGEQGMRWPLEAATLRLRLHVEANEAKAVEDVAQEAMTLLAESGQALDKGPESAQTLRLLTNNLAAPLTGSGRHDLALPLWERLASGRLPNEWSYLWYAECTWAVTRDRARTMGLLREAARSRFDDELRHYFINRADGFRDVRDDPEFLAALAPPS